MPYRESDYADEDPQDEQEDRMNYIYDEGLVEVNSDQEDGTDQQEILKQKYDEYFANQQEIEDSDEGQQSSE